MLLEANNMTDILYEKQGSYLQGIAEGLEKGRAETRGEEKEAVARRMLAKGMSIAEIVELAAISEAEVLGLQKEM